MRSVEHLSRAVPVAVLLAMGACAGAASTADTPPDPSLEARLEAATTPEYRLEVLFDWNMVDRDARLGGRGLLRLDRGDRARVDLFGPRGETLAAAIVEGDVMRVVPQAAAALLPPPAMLRAALGVFRAPDNAVLAATRSAGGEISLEYRREGTRWTFDFNDDKLQAAEWTDGAGRRTVQLSGDAGFGMPRQTGFRDWTEFRELTLSVSEIQEITAFDADTWTLPGER